MFYITVNCTWDEFSDWTTCTKTCGGGLQVRQRKVAVVSQFGGSACQGGAAEQRLCSTQNCPRKSSKLVIISYMLTISLPM